MVDKIAGGGVVDSPVSAPSRTLFQPLPEEQRPESFGYNTSYNISHVVWANPHRVGCVTGASPLLREMVLDAARSARVAMGLPAEFPDG